MNQFELHSQFEPQGDQPKAIEKIVNGIEHNERHQTLLGATGTGKTFTVSNVVKEINRPTLVIAHNKTLAGQLYSEFKEFFQIMRLSISSVITITTSLKLMSRIQIRILKKTLVLMMRLIS